MTSPNDNAEPPLIQASYCPKCRAANAAHKQRCWLCEAPLDQSKESDNPYAVRPATVGGAQASLPLPAPSSQPSPTQRRIEAVFLCLLVATVLLVLMVAIGLGAQDSGLLTMFLFIVVPSLAAAGVSGLYSVAKGETPRPSKMFMTLIYSAFMTIGLLALLIVGSVIFFLMICAQMLGGFHP